VEAWIHVKGMAVHGALRELGDNAIEKALALIAEIQSHPGSAHEHPLLGRNIPMVWEIRGGQPLNVVPDACSVHLDWRVTPGGPSSVELFDWLVEAAARVDGDVEVVEVVEPFETQPDAVLAQALAGAVRRTTGTTPPATGMIAWTDAHNFVDHGGSQAVVFGPGHLRNAHRPDEFVSLTDVVTCARSLAALIADTAALVEGDA
jgi:acetylornithine deacetylase/succinyl-diaminopimelate desuccinylase-like protein